MIILEIIKFYNIYVVFFICVDLICVLCKRYVIRDKRKGLIWYFIMLFYCFLLFLIELI